MASRSLVCLLAVLQLGVAFRMKKQSHNTKLHAPKLVAGVPLLNTDIIEDSQYDAGSLVDASGARDWIVMLSSDTTDVQLANFCEESKVACTPEGHARVTPFVEVHGTEDDLKEILEAHPGEVDFVEPDVPIYAIPELPGDDAEGASVQQATWGLNKIGKTASTNGGEGVHVYVCDTGVRTSHTDFGGRAVPTLEYLGTRPKECNGDASCANDVNGHGTHCAGTVGGNTWGVASKSTLHAVKVLSNSGRGSVSWIVGAFDWIVTNGQRPAVVSASLGGGGRAAAYQRSIDVATSRGVTVIVAAGNNNADACNFSPAYVPSAITVGSTASNDARSGFSNYGSCVEIWAPGSSIKSAGHRSDTASATMSGTSMACPHVAGAAALLLEAQPSLTPAAVLSQMRGKALTGKITGLKSTDTNKFLFLGEGVDQNCPLCDLKSTTVKGDFKWCHARLVAQHGGNMQLVQNDCANWYACPGITCYMCKFDSQSNRCRNTGGQIDLSEEGPCGNNVDEHCKAALIEEAQEDAEQGQGEDLIQQEGGQATNGTHSLVLEGSGKEGTSGRRRGSGSRNEPCKFNEECDPYFVCVGVCWSDP